MTGEITAQVYAAPFMFANPLKVPEHIPVDIVYDNEVAAKFVRAVAGANRHKELHAIIGTLANCVDAKADSVDAYVLTYGRPPQ